MHLEPADTGGLQEVKAETRKAFLAKKSEEAEKSKRTLEKLLDTYVDYLKVQGRRSYVDAQRIFQKPVMDVWVIPPKRIGLRSRFRRSWPTAV